MNQEIDTGALEATLEWVGKTEKHSDWQQNWVGKYPFFNKWKSGRAVINRAYPAPTPLSDMGVH